MSTQIQTRVLIWRGDAHDNIAYLLDKEAMFILGLPEKDGKDGIKLRIGDVIEVENENRKIDSVWISFLNKDLGGKSYPETGVIINSSFGQEHSYNCEINLMTSSVRSSLSHPQNNQSK